MFGPSLKIAGAIFKEGLKLIYEYIGTVILISILWFTIGFAPMIFVTVTGLGRIPLVFILAILATFFTLGPSTAGVHETLALILNRELFSFTDFFSGFRKHYWRSVGLMTLNIVVWGILILNMYFYLTMFKAPVLVIIATVSLTFYMLGFWALMNVWFFPLLVQRPRKVTAILKQAALLALDNLVVSWMITLMSVLVLVVSFFLRVGLVLFLIGGFATFQDLGFLKILDRYKAMEEAKEAQKKNELLSQNKEDKGKEE